jgi:hypothetical protein
MTLRNRLLAGFAAASLAIGPANAQVIIGGGGGGSGAGSVTSVATGACLTGGPITTTGTISGTYVNRAVTTTSDTILSTDACKIVTYSNASAIAVALPQATGSFAAGYSFDVENKAAGLVTVTPTTSTINGAATLTVAQNTGCTIWSDGANWQSLCLHGPIVRAARQPAPAPRFSTATSGAFGAIAGSSWNGTTLVLPNLTMPAALNFSSDIDLRVAGTTKISTSGGSIFLSSFTAWGTHGAGIGSGTPSGTSPNVTPDWTDSTGLGLSSLHVLDLIANSTDMVRVATTGMSMVAGVFTTKGFTVATLPASPATGSEAYVTDANAACTYGGTATGGGSTVCKMLYNGAAWKEN